MIVGHDRAVEEFLAAWRSGRMHHAWLLGGARGRGKRTFADLAAQRLLADASGPPPRESGLAVDGQHPVARLLAAGSHPDFRCLERMERPTGGLARNISVDQVRSLREVLSVTGSLSAWRVVVIDAADDLEASAANALLKLLEEPPASTVFLLIAHAPGRLLPTIRSRCRQLAFGPLSDDAMTSIMEDSGRDLSETERDAILAFAAGSPGEALRAIDLDLGNLDRQARAIIADGDPDNRGRAALAQSLALKSAADRYHAFLELVPAVLARECATMRGNQRARALDAYQAAREMAAAAPRLTLDPAATVFNLGTLLASVALKE